MVAGTMAFALGALFAHQLARLPDPLYAGLLPLLLPLLLRGGRLLVGAAFCAGIAWTVLHAHAELAARLPAALHGQQWLLEGRVARPPRARDGYVGFVLAVERAVPHNAGGWRWRGCRVRLGWYRPPPHTRLRAGERWRLSARLRPPRGLRNRGGFDAEHRALREGLCAVGYVHGAPEPVPVAGPAPGLASLRETLAARVRAHVVALPAGGIIEALAVGLRDRVSPQQRLLMQHTGTAHLMAISGLHVGLVAGLGMLLGASAARASRAAMLRLPARHWGAVTALLAAGTYAALAGFAVPTQRALVMLAVFLGASLARRGVGRHAGLALALAVVLALDPLAALDAGTWLSFAAVAGLLHAVAPRQAASGTRPSAVLGTVVRVQLAATLTLVPLTLLCFGYQSPVAPLANLLAVPVTGLLVVPMTLAGLVLDLLPIEAGGWLLRGAAHVMGILLEALDDLPGAGLVFTPAASPDVAALLAAALALALLGLPLGPRAWLVAAALLSPLLLPVSAAPVPGALRLQVLDVGQGLAVIVRTARHTLVFDAGPGWGPGAGAGSHVVAPALRRGGVSVVDRLVVSHHHRDHAGGAPGLLAAMPVTARLGDAAPGEAPACRDGQAWHWDGYDFRVLHPQGPAGPGNDASCVLHVRGPGGSVLLPADVESPAEARLLATHGYDLRADVLLVPHHGSATSSSPAFLAAVRPALALNSSGHRNRFRHPSERVTRRYRRAGVVLLDTACAGELRVDLSPGRPLRVRTWADDGLRFWHGRDVGPRCARG